MALIRLQDIGKIYVSEGSVAVGIRGVNLSFESGEFVAITGASGSGKSTLLNVISGMDSYEEGELYVNEQPTSHYVQADWEEYRKEYISFIFQEYNIVDSFTVLQNVELALMHIKNITERRKRALELIEKVGLSDHIHHKGSKLSGGQKQRTVIARALAKDSPIILADEPTGNLDSKSSEEIINLLREISANKLVIIVTHNFEEVEHCATRVIRVFDGAIESDRRLTENIAKTQSAPDATPDSALDAASENQPVADPSAQIAPSVYSEPSTIDKILDNLRNGIHLGAVRFFAKPKLAIFLSLLMLISVLGCAMITSGSQDAFSFKKTEDIFTEIPGRLIITSRDGVPFSDEKLAEVAKAVSADSTMHYDFLLDNSVATYQEGIDTLLEYNCQTNYDGKPDLGRLPEAADEVMVAVPISAMDVYGKDSIQVTELPNLFFGANYKVVGVDYFYDNTKPSIIVFTPEGYNLATTLSLFNSSLTDAVWLRADVSGYVTENCEIGGETKEYNIPVSSQNIDVRFDIPGDSFYLVPPAFSTLLSASGEIVYSFDSPTGQFTSITKEITYTLEASKQLKTLSPELQQYIADSGAPGTLIVGVDIVKDLIQRYYASGYGQASLFFSNNREAEAAIPKLRELGFNGVLSNATAALAPVDVIFGLIGVVFELVIWFAVMVFIAMFLNLCSKKAMLASSDDIAIMRSMGISGTVIQISIYVQMIMAAIPALFLSGIFFAIIFTLPKTNAMFPYIHAKEYLLIALGVIVVSVVMARRLVKKLFSSTVKKTLKGGLEK